MKQILIFLALIGISSCAHVKIDEKNINTEDCQNFKIEDLGHVWKMTILSDKPVVEVCYQYTTCLNNRVICKFVTQDYYSSRTYNKYGSTPVRWGVDGCWSNWYKTTK